MTRQLTYKDAVNEAIRLEMRNDPSVILIGEDVAGGAGGRCMCTGSHVHSRFTDAQEQRCTGAEVQRCRGGAEVQRRRCTGVQRCGWCA